ncbi:Hydrolase family protein/HAD-superfamily protein isoform 3 [Gossypium australe]|uniref:Hydrolase family protein/HAD-superfamily protein isoform 3 n=1 Tax=Gossypium australe TaxID=47621 RepID=A0A5B6U6A5_9ROSI|nr:Hydrolase family protein/HAD-superfamily protein isoform 3 [Gossypium australe]
MQFRLPFRLSVLEWVLLELHWRVSSTGKVSVSLHLIVLIEINPKRLEYVTYGKPNPFVFKNAEVILSQLQSSSCQDHSKNNGVPGSHPFETLYMIGDNPSVDVEGAQQAGHPWFSILTRTGVFQGKDNHAEFPADLANLPYFFALPDQISPLVVQVVDSVEEAVDYILNRECIELGA